MSQGVAAVDAASTPEGSGDRAGRARRRGPPADTRTRPRRHRPSRPRPRPRPRQPRRRPTHERWQSAAVRRHPTVSVPDAWEQTVKSQVKPLVRALYSAGSFVGNRGDTWLFSRAQRGPREQVQRPPAGRRGRTVARDRCTGDDRVRQRRFTGRPTTEPARRRPRHRRRPAADAATGDAPRPARPAPPDGAATTSPSRSPTSRRPTRRSISTNSPTHRPSRSRPRSIGWPRRSPAPN